MDREQTSRAWSDVELAYGVLLDDLQALAQRIARGTGGREVALAITNLQVAMMWADMARKLRQE